jgi:tetratricopeptide (TPR) repeat protein
MGDRIFLSIPILHNLDDRLLMVAGWTANVTLMVNLAARFLGGGVGLVGVAAVAVPSVLGLLQVGSEFTKSGKEGFDRFLGVIRVPQQWREEMKLVITLGVLGGLCVLWLQLPEFSKLESRSGLKSYQDGKLGDAEQSFQKAIALDAENVDAHYNLGALYDHLEQPEKAKKEYLIAIAGKLPDAYNNLARLYIKEKKYPQAAALLIQGMSTQEKLETIEAQTRYSLAKNLGWVRLEQKREEEAQEWLKVAIGIAESTEGVKGAVNPGVAHCLMAQVMERQKQPAIGEWQKCRELGSVTNPDEDTLLYQANQKLKKK